MNKDEIMIEEMAKAIRKAMVEYVGEKYYELCVAGFSADIISKALYNTGHRKIADDEIVLNKKDYEKLCHLAYFGYEDVKQETAREILQTIENYGFRSLYDKKYGKHYKLTDYMIANIKHKYGIELED